MNKISCIFLFAFVLLASCTKNASLNAPKNQLLTATQTQVAPTGVANSDSANKTSEWKTATGNTLVLMPDSLFQELELALEVISKADFDNYIKSYKTNCPVDRNGFPEGLGLTVSDTCAEICEAYLVDSTNKKRLQLPSDYDSGILGLLPAPNCREFVVFSSYDQPDFDKFYAYRATIYGFSIGKGIGLEIIKPAFRISTKVWSLEELVWINDREIALKTYEEERAGDGNSTAYRYFKVKLNR